MTTSIDPDSFGFLVADIARMIRAELFLKADQAGLDLTPAEMRTLMHAARAGRVRQFELAERMGVEAMTLSVSLDRLEARGLVERSACERDRRAKTVHLTDAGHVVLARLKPLAAAAREAAAVGIPPEDWARLQTMLKKVRENLAAVRSGGGREGTAS